MTERPILFSGPMVRAILDGTKTETRRLAPLETHGRFPYGKPGDRLWVRETWRVAGELCDTPGPQLTPAYRDDIRYRATEEDGTYGNGSTERWRPSIHMPRWACRLVLEVKDVRVERLQDIDDSGAFAEGILPQDCNGRAPRRLFQELWDSLNGKRAPWESNPWVWVIEFERATADAGHKNG